jgi:hypothetical protein
MLMLNLEKSDSELEAQFYAFSVFSRQTAHTQGVP